MDTLTPQELRVLQTIERLKDKDGKNPSYREVMHELNYRSTASIYRFVKSLVKKGRLASIPRSWRILTTDSRESETGAFEIEIIGSITRSRPPQLFERPEHIGIPKSFHIPGAPIYGLYIQDASFIDEQMIPSDLILVYANPSAEEGSLVLASSDVSIIGRYHEERDNLRFYVSPYASSDDSKSISTDAASTQIWGIIIGVIRSYGPKKAFS